MELDPSDPAARRPRDSRSGVARQSEAVHSAGKKRRQAQQVVDEARLQMVQAYADSKQADADAVVGAEVKNLKDWANLSEPIV